MDYHRLFQDAVNSMAQAYENGVIKLHTEADLQSYLFFHIVTLMGERIFQQPYKIHANYGLKSTAREKIDLVLGDNDVLVELKYEPDNRELPQSKRPVVLKADIERDFERMERHAQQSWPHCFVLLFDEDGQHLRRYNDLNWRKLRQGRKEAFLLLRAY